MGGSFWIDDIPAERFGGNLKNEYTYTPPQISADSFKGRKSSSFVLLNTAIGFGILTLPMIFEGTDRYNVTIKKSKFDQAILGKHVLTMDDGFLYDVYLDEFGGAAYPNECMIECEYTVPAIRRGKDVTVTGNTVFCDSTAPETDCILTATVGQTGENYEIGTVTFPEVTAGEIITVDGINKRILVNGAPAADRAEWTWFPSLSPGINHITCQDTLTVQFHPVYL